MPDFGALPPEVNSARMYSGPGSGPMMAAASAWNALAGRLESVSRGYSSTIATLQGESWSGSASVAMASAAVPYVAWVTTAGSQAEEAASRARAAAAAYETAFAATVPPSQVTANRTQLSNLVANNVFGQNTMMIAATEATYAEMWAQDAAAMYGYAASSSAATTLTQFSEPPPTTNAAGQSAQAAAVAQTAGTSTATNSQTALSQLMSVLPQQLQTLASGASTSSSAASGSSLASPLAAAVGTSPLLSGFGAFNTLTAPVNLGGGISRTITSAGSFQTGLQRVAIQSGGDGAAKVAAQAVTAEGAGLSSGGVRGPVLASVGKAAPVGQLSVPQSWAAATPATSAVDQPLWQADTDLEAAPAWEINQPTTMLGGAPAAGVGAMTGMLARPTVNRVLRVASRGYKMPRPTLGG